MHPLRARANCGGLRLFICLPPVAPLYFWGGAINASVYVSVFLNAQGARGDVVKAARFLLRSQRKLTISMGHKIKMLIGAPAVFNTLLTGCIESGLQLTERKKDSYGFRASERYYLKA